MSLKIALRSYQRTDFESLHTIDQACYGSDVAYSRAELRTYLGFLGAECVVAQTDSDPVRGPSDDGAVEGTRVVGFCISIRRGDHGHIITMDVLKEFRRNGIGTSILREIERRLISAGVRRVALETATDNGVAVTFWKRHDYVSVGVKKGYYAGKRDAYYMTKELGPAAEVAEAQADKPKRTGAGRRKALKRGAAT